MSGTLKKVITILAILLIGMLLLYTVINILFPNLMNAMIGNVEESIRSMTSFEIDIDGNGIVGPPDTDRNAEEDDRTYNNEEVVSGWGGGGGD